jgi:hypothetical protein
VKRRYEGRPDPKSFLSRFFSWYSPDYI